MSLSKEIQEFIGGYDTGSQRAADEEKNKITREHNAAINRYYDAKNQNAMEIARMKLANDPKTLERNAYNQGYSGANFAIPELDASNTAPTGDERDLKIRTVYGEAGSEAPEGQAAVAHIFNNRVKSGQWGDNARDVITAPKQFSVWNPGNAAGEKARALDPNSKEYQAIGKIIDLVDAGKIPDPTNGATHYYAHNNVNPDWAPELAAKNKVVIGNHTFVGKLPTQVATAQPAPATAAIPPANTYASATDTLDDTDPYESEAVYGHQGGGTVYPTPGPGRDNRVAQAQPGVAIPTGGSGTMPGGDVTASIAASPGYEGGGPAPDQSQAPDPSSLLSGLGEALHSGADYIANKFNLHQASSQAVPTADAPSGADAFHRGEGAASPQDLEAVTNTIDPQRKFSDSLRTAAGLNAVYQYHKNRGDYDKASKAAAELMLHLKGVAAQYGDQAYNYLRQGDLAKGAESLQNGYNRAYPNGLSVKATVNNDRTTTLAEHDHNGELVNHVTLTPQQLLGASLGMKSGASYWQVLQQAAGKKGPEYQDPKTIRSPEQSAAYQSYLQGRQNRDQTAIPTAPEITSMHPMDAQLAARQHQLDLSTWRVANPTGAKASGAGELKPHQRAQVYGDIDSAVTNYNDALPKDVKLTPGHIAPLKNAAFNIFMHGNTSPEQAVMAADDMSDPTNPSIDNAKEGKDGQMSVRLRNGTNINLSPDAYASVMAYRKQRIHEDSVSAGQYGQSQKGAERFGAGRETVLDSILSTKGAGKRWLNSIMSDYEASKGQ